MLSDSQAGKLKEWAPYLHPPSFSQQAVATMDLKQAEAELGLHVVDVQSKSPGVVIKRGEETLCKTPFIDRLGHIHIRMYIDERTKRGEEPLVDVRLA